MKQLADRFTLAIATQIVQVHGAPTRFKPPDTTRVRLQVFELVDTALRQYLPPTNCQVPRRLLSHDANIETGPASHLDGRAHTR